MNDKRLFGINYKATNYEETTETIIQYAIEKKSFGVSALAVHGLIEAYRNNNIRASVNQIDWVVPDGQPIKWALNSFYRVGLKDRVYGPTLTLKVLEKANTLGLSVYLYGSSSNTAEKFACFIQDTFPKIIICGIHVDRFREATMEEDKEDINKINESKPNIVLVGRGCPRQEIWVANHLGKIQAPMMAVGAAFDFHAGTVKQAPKWIQDNGLEWMFRLIQEPQRLWKRYLITNSYFIYLFAKFKLLKLEH